jgi:probable rRNA maturation factor
MKISSSHSRKRATTVIDIVVESPLWKAQRNVEAVVRRAIREAACAVSAIEGEIAVVLTDDCASRTLNRNWRSKDVPTNVLSFPAGPDRLVGAHPARGTRAKKNGAAPHLLGDIVIAYETMEREARAERKPFAHHLAHLAVHGYLHLVGYDHRADDEAQAMEGLETEILARLDVPDPYIARGTDI